MTSEINRCYRVLELEPGASLEQVKQAWRELVKVWHPDRFPNDAKLQRKAQERLKDINGAYEMLEKYLTSGTPPPRSRATSSQSSESHRQENRERQETKSERTEPPSPPPQPESSPTSAPAKSNAGVIWAVVVGVVIVLLVLANSGNDSNRSGGASSFGSPSGGGSSGFTPPPTQAFVPPPVSKALDEKNGFKDFRFGMTPEEARAVLPPSDVTEKPGANVTTFNYRGTPANRIGEFATDFVSLNFFEGHLYRIDLWFSNFQNEILEAFRVNFGEPFDADSWKRGDQPLRGKAWRGEKVSAAILALPSQAWDSVVLYNNEAKQKAQEYAAKEPERAAKDFGTSGFKSLILGMKLQDLTVPFDVVEEDRVAAVKKVAFRKGDWRSVGFYPLATLSAEFFNDKLYRIDFGVEQNQKEMFETFKQRFGQLQDNDTWTRGAMKLKAKSAMNSKLLATILAPSTSYGSSDNWDAIVLLDADLWREAEQFKKDAPKRAAKDF